MAVDIHGGYGCMEEYAVSRYLRDAFVLGPSAGTSDIMKVIIGRWVLSNWNSSNKSGSHSISNTMNLVAYNQ